MEDLLFVVFTLALLILAPIDFYLRFKSGWTKQEIEAIKMDYTKGSIIVWVIVGLIIYLTP